MTHQHTARNIRRGVEWLMAAARLASRFGLEMLISNLAQARLVLSRPLRVHPHWIDYRTRLRTPAARMLLGTLISMTPGTLTCDLDGDRLQIHVLGMTPDSDVVERIRERFESLLVKMEEL